MLRDSTAKALFVFPLLGLLVILAGCGNNQADSSAPTSTPPPKAPAKMAAAGPALSEKMTFDQLALYSPVKRVQNKQGVVYLHFSYVDGTGKVYKCELPDAQSKGSYLRDEWLHVFSIYRLPTVVKNVAPPPNPLAKSVGDFPFISPRPTPTASPSAASPERGPEPISPPPPPPSAPQSGSRPPAGRPSADTNRYGLR